jgi:hypothetical protein
MQILADDPFMPYERFASLAGPEVAAERMTEIHAQVLRKIVRFADLKTSAEIDESRYLRRGPFYVLRSDLIESAILGAAASRTEVASDSVLTLPNGWNEASKVDAYVLFTAEVFVLHALSQNLLVTDEAIVKLADAAGFSLTEQEISNMKDMILGGTVLKADTVRAIERLFHSGVRSCSHPAFIRELSAELKGPSKADQLCAWTRLVIAPALRSGLKSITRPHASHVFMSDSAMKEFFALQLHALLARFTARPLVNTDTVRKNALMTVLCKLAESLPQASDLAILKHLESLGLSYTPSEVYAMIERFEEVTILPAAILAVMWERPAGVPMTDLDINQLTALAPEGSRLRIPRVMRVAAKIWQRECLVYGFCIDQGRFWQLSPEGAQRAFVSMVPTVPEH